MPLYKRLIYVLLSGALGLVGASSYAQADRDVEKPLTIVSWGGAYEEAQQRAIITPYEVSSSRKTRVISYNGTLHELIKRSLKESWDVIDMTEDQAIAACEAGLLRPVEYEDILWPSRKLGIEDDFIEGAFQECSVAQNLFASVYAYDERAFTGRKPAKIADFFDVEHFPGKRAMARSPDSILEWALLSEGVPVRQIYDLLSTERGLKLAFKRLDNLLGNVVWYDNVAEAAELLVQGKAAMASGFNGRFFAAVNEGNAPISIVWDGQVIAYSVWAISAASTQVEQAEDFIRFATSPDPLARLAEHIPYAPARQSALERVGRHYRSLIPMRDHLPNAPQRTERVLMRDSQWYAHTQQLRQRRFDEWLKKHEK